MSHYTNEDGRLIVVAEDGTETPVYAKLSGGILHCMVRANDEATFDAVGLQVGLLQYENPAQDAVLDEEGNEVTPAVPASGAIIPVSGATVTRIGPHVLSPAVLDEEGNEVSPAVTDGRYHANFWIREDSDWESWIVQWMAGTEGSPNANEASIEAMGVELIDPLTVTTPHNVLL